MLPGQHNLTLQQGATFRRCFLWKDSADVPIDLSGWLARMHIREKVESTQILASLTTENGRIELQPGGLTGRIVLSMGATVTAALKFESAVYDVEFYDPNDLDEVIPYLQGKVKLKFEVTR